MHLMSNSKLVGPPPREMYLSIARYTRYIYEGGGLATPPALLLIYY